MCSDTNCWGFPTGGVLIIAQRRDSTLAQYFTWFGKIAYIHGRVYIIEIYRERITIYMEEEDYITLLYSQLSHTAVAALSLNSHSRFLSFLLSLCFSNVGLYL